MEFVRATAAWVILLHNKFAFNILDVVLLFDKIQRAFWLLAYISKLLPKTHFVGGDVHDARGMCFALSSL